MRFHCYLLIIRVVHEKHIPQTTRDVNKPLDTTPGLCERFPIAHIQATSKKLRIKKKYAKWTIIIRGVEVFSVVDRFV